MAVTETMEDIKRYSIRLAEPLLGLCTDECDVRLHPRRSRNANKAIVEHVATLLTRTGHAKKRKGMGDGMHHGAVVLIQILKIL